MSRTRRRIPYTAFRFPKRNIQGRDIDKVRVGAIPPTGFDDLNFCRESIGAYPFMRRMLDRGWDVGKIVKVVSTKYRVSLIEARSLMDFILDHP